MTMKKKGKCNFNIHPVNFETFVSVMNEISIIGVFKPTAKRDVSLSSS